MNTPISFITQTIPVESTSFPFNVMIVEFPNNAEPIMHSHYCMELTYVLEGDGEYIISEKKYHIKTGDFLIINGHEYHGLVRNLHNLKIVVIAFHPNLIWNGIDDLDYSFLKVFYDGTEDFYHYFPQDHPILPTVSSLFLDIMHEWEQHAVGYQLILKANLLKLLALLYREFETSATHGHIISKFHDDYNKIIPCIKYIENHLCESIQLGELAQIAHMSQGYFSTVFKRIMKSSPTEYILKRRLANARLLLKSTNLQVSEIAFECGFSDLSAFNKKFKAEYNITPLQYRNS